MTSKANLPTHLPRHLTTTTDLPQCLIFRTHLPLSPNTEHTCLINNTARKVTQCPYTPGWVLALLHTPVFVVYEGVEDVEGVMGRVSGVWM